VGRSNALSWALAASAPLLLAFSCTESYTSDSLMSQEKQLDVPSTPELDAWQRAYLAGQDRWRADPKQVADVALRQELDLDLIPWFPDAYRPTAYQLKYREDWGAYVVRYYTFPSGGVMHYRVKVRQYQDVWYPIQVSHYKEHTLLNPALED
jgi:hypothetical protein